MNMKYFRFLYGEIAGCFTHFGELNDTLTKEHITFLYLSGIRGNKGELKSENSLFVYPDYLDMVVLHEVNARTADVLKAILLKTKIGTLVMPDKLGESVVLNQEDDENDTKRKKGMKEFDTKSVEDKQSLEFLRACMGEELRSVEKIVALDIEKNSSFCSVMCGWKFFARNSGENELALVHAMAETGFEDVVMNVKDMSETRACRKSCAPDQFGCAFGCTLHRDYQECKYRRKNESGISCRTGAFLLGSGKSMSRTDDPILEQKAGKSLVKSLLKESKIEQDELRFFGFSGDAWKLICREYDLTEKEYLSGTEYFIGSGSEVDNDAVAEVGRSGLYRIPVLLEEGQGICCSGFFKYREVMERRDV